MALIGTGKRGATLRLRVQPRAKRDGLDGLRGDALVVRITAPPVEGKANDACRKLLGRLLDVGQGNIEILRGDTGRDKLIEVVGESPASLLQRLRPHLPADINEDELVDA